MQDDIRTGLAESMRFGTTQLGDISGDGGSWEVLSETSLHAVVFREMLGLTAERAAKAWAESDAWLTAHQATATCRPGISPHAPYSVRSSLFLAASTSGCPTAIHLSETADENELLGHYRGPFVRFLQDLGVWAPDGLAEDADHVLRLFNGLSPALFIHCNYLRPDVLFPPNGSIIYCPRTHAAFGHAPHPYREFLARGVRVALGTDSLASNPDLDLFAEARFLRQCHPDVTGGALLRMATLSGAEALGWGNETGSLDTGKSADFVALTIPNKQTNDPHDLLLDDTAAVQRVLCFAANSAPDGIS